MDGSPADFAFDGEALSVVCCDGGSALDGVGRKGSVGGGALGSVFDGSSGFDADRAVVTDAVGFENIGDATGFFDGEDEVIAVVF